MQVRPRLSEHRSAASLYIAMAHAGLATALLVLYGLYLLLADFLRPLQWALLYSVPLRKTQRALIVFWEPQLRGGLSATLLALPLAALRSSTATLTDAHAVLLRHPLLGSPASPRLLRWLVFFFFFLVLLERLNASGDRFSERVKKARERTETARENFRQLDPHLGKWQVRFGKLLEMSYIFLIFICFL